jgi:hypothetical protein
MIIFFCFTYHNLTSLINYQYNKNSFYYKKVNDCLVGYPIIDQWEQTRSRPIFSKDLHIHATPGVVRKYKHNSYMTYKFILLVTLVTILSMFLVSPHYLKILNI